MLAGGALSPASSIAIFKGMQATVEYIRLFSRCIGASNRCNPKPPQACDFTRSPTMNLV